jgi:large subunit ribosomal protein L25
MHELTIQAERRAERKKQTKSLRRTGKVPGVFYIHGEDTIPVTVQEKSLKPLIFSLETHIINLTLDDGSMRKCILRDIQFDPLSERPVHFDVQGLRDDEEISIEVPIKVIGGIPVGVKDGGILQQFAYRIKISCLPRHIPDHVEVNPEELKVNQFVHVSDLKIENVTILDSESTTIVGVVPPLVEKEATPAVATEETVEPEVIGKGKKVEGEEGAAEGSGEKDAKSAEPKEEKKK